MGLILVTSAGADNGPGRDALLSFDAAGDLVWRFTETPHRRPAWLDP